MDDVWVVNASPIIVLAKCGLLDLLTSQCQKLVVPEAVAAEVLKGPSDDPARIAIEGGWGKLAAPKIVPADVSEWNLGIGESSVIAIALELPSAVAVLDDAAGRACARAMGVSLLGSLGVVARAKRQGLISSAADAFATMRNAGLYLDAAIVNRVLMQLGESSTFQ